MNIYEEEREAARKAMLLTVYQRMGDIASQIEFTIRKQKHGKPVDTIGQSSPEDIIKSLWDRLNVLESITCKQENELNLHERNTLEELL